MPEIAQNIQDNQEDLLDNLDNAIILNRLVEVKAIIDQHPSILNQTYSDGKTPIFYAIASNNPDIVSAIIGKDPSVLTKTLPNGYNPIFQAIFLGKLDAVKTIIQKDPSVLTQTLPNQNTPIFEAICSGNPNIVSVIIEKDPSVLTQTLPTGMMVITYATQSCLSSSGSPDEKAKRSEILTIILKKQFGENITPIDQSDLEELLFNKSLLNGLRSKLDSLNGFNYLKNAFDKINPQDTFDNVYKDLFKSVDKNIPVELEDGSKMYIFSSNLKEHVSFFIFHTDANNKLKSISYCDGNYADIESQKIKNSSTHIKGITTFHLKDAIDYSESFAKEFINKNSEGKSIFDLYDKFKKSEISGVAIDFSKTTHSIPTKIQKRGNCGFKSTSLLARFILERKDPGMNFDYDETTQKKIGAGHNEYKKFKTNLIKKSLDSVSKLKDKISAKLDSFSRYLKNEIEIILGTTDDYVEAKREKTQVDGASPQKEVGSPILERGDELPKSPSITPQKEVSLPILEREAPRASCFPFFLTCFGRNNDTSTGK